MPDPAQTGIDHLVFVYDGNCRFCRRWVAHARQHSRARIEFLSSRQAADRFPDLDQQQLVQASALLVPGSETVWGARAILGSGAHGAIGQLLLAAMDALPGFARLVEGVYRRVARNRQVVSRAIQMVETIQADGYRHQFTARIVERGIALTYVVAFASIAVQARGLFGQDGIHPMATYFEMASHVLGGVDLLRLPSLFWWNQSNGFIVAVAVFGIGAGAVAATGRAVGPLLLICWNCYLSFLGGGGQFMSFQWDMLLVEAGFLALVRRTFAGNVPSTAMIWLFRLLLFKVMVMSGLVKLFSNDGTWTTWTALEYHFQTQPLPHSVAWFAHHLPDRVLAAGVGFTWFAELFAPFLIFCGTLGRRIAGITIIALQLAIAATGNYGFFNLLTIVLAFSLFDDRLLARLPWRIPALAPPAWPLTGQAARLAVAGAFVCMITLVPLGRYIDVQPARWAAELQASTRQLGISSGYGLFANMTRTQPEIVFEATLDGRDWEPYGFRYKQADPARPPAFAGPHMPRLDWQLWFAALGGPQRNRWTNEVLDRLCRQVPAVVDLFASAPFAGAQPQQVRAQVYEVRFTTPVEQAETGHWWHRSRPRAFGRPLHCAYR